jgi:hypothetical protein
MNSESTWMREIDASRHAPSHPERSPMVCDLVAARSRRISPPGRTCRWPAVYPPWPLADPPAWRFVGTQSGTVGIIESIFVIY